MPKGIPQVGPLQWGRITAAQTTVVQKEDAQNVAAEDTGSQPAPAQSPPTGHSTQTGGVLSGLSLDDIKVELGTLGFPMGWENWRPGPQFAVCYKVKEKNGETTLKRSCRDEEAAFIWVRVVIGWLITAFAVMFGAPFWFDLLGKLVSLRAAGKNPDKCSQCLARSEARRASRARRPYHRLHTVGDRPDGRARGAPRRPRGSTPGSTSSTTARTGIPIGRHESPV